MQAFLADGAVLESALGEYRHIYTNDRFDPACDDFALQAVKPVDVVFGQRQIRDAFGNLDHVRASEWTKTVETKGFRRGVGSGVGTAQSTGIGQRVFDFPNTPSFLVKHGVVDDAADGQLGILVDGIIFEILVAAVAIHQVLPIGVALANPAA